MHFHNERKKKKRPFPNPTHSCDRYGMAQAAKPALIVSWEPRLSFVVSACLNPRKQTHFKLPS